MQRTLKSESKTLKAKSNRDNHSPSQTNVTTYALPGYPQPAQQLLTGQEPSLEEIRQRMEQYLAQPRLSPNILNALKLANQHASEGETTARASVEKSLKENGFDLDAHPDLYDRIVKHLQQSPVTINIKTTLLEALMQAGSYLNQWEKSVHPSKDKKAYYGDSNYAITRNETEKTLHGLPELEPVGEAAEHISPGWQKRNEKAVATLERKVKELSEWEQRLSDIKRQQQVQEQILATVLEEVAYSKNDNLDIQEIDQRKQRYAEEYQKKEWLSQEEARLEKNIQSRRQEMPALSSWLEGAKLDLANGKGKIDIVEQDSQGFRENRTLPVERPHSAAINAAYRAGSAPNPIYGTSHMVLKDAIKQHSTVTGGDSLEHIYKKFDAEEATRSVGTFTNLGVVLHKANPQTLKMLAEEALSANAQRRHTPGKSETASYLEVQVFGPINIARDIEKIVVDEDDLEAWAKRALVDYRNQPIPARDKDEIKRAIENHAEALGIDIQYIRTGQSKLPGGFGAIRGAGEHLSARRQPFEERGESALKAFRAGSWGTGLKASDSFQDMGSGSLFGPKYKSSGLKLLAGKMKKIQTLANSSQPQPLSEEALKKLAAETLSAFYHSPIDPQYIDEFKRVLSNTMNAFNRLVLNSIQERN